MSPGAAPVLIGVLHDRVPADGGTGFEALVRRGIDTVANEGRLDREVAFVHASGAGLPDGTAHAVTQAFGELVQAGVVAIIGPAISDNGLVARDLADAARIPCINYTGGEQTRSEWMFHYQIGSLEEEPTVLARHLAARGHRTVAVVHDRSPIGRRYAEFFDDAADGAGLTVAGRSAVSPVATDLTEIVPRLRATSPDALVYLGLGLAAHPLSRAMDEAAWAPPTVGNSALMWGYAYPEWAGLWEGWVYVDAVAEDNPLLAELQAGLDSTGVPGPGTAGAFDMGRLMGEALSRAWHLTPEGVKDGLERVKMLPAAIGRPGTTMGFGQWERAALKGEYLVLRVWRGGESVLLSS